IAVKDQKNYMKCNWTPFMHKTFAYEVSTTIVSGQLAWHQQQLFLNCQGQQLEINR
ncbi:MAG: dihydroorotase, partial [Acinetobacter sp.]|nr:dihydroorotase [Acinetobacter sp.]